MQADAAGDNQPDAVSPFRWESLAASARLFARACAENFSQHDAAFFYLHAGASVELGLKAALCKKSPALLMESNRAVSDSSLLAFLGLLPADPSVQLKATRLYTVGFEGAIKRFFLVYGTDALNVSPEELQQLKVARDVTAHSGAVHDVPSDTLLSVLVTLGRAFDSLAPILEEAPADFWGRSYRVVQRASREWADVNSATAETLLSAARSRFEAAYGDLDEDTLSDMIEQSRYRVEPNYPTEWYRTCPVCSGTGKSTVRPAKRKVVRRGRPVVERGWVATDFRCPLCGLSLMSEQVVEATRDFDAWEIAADGDNLRYWAEDMGSDLDADDVRALGLDA